MKSYIEKGRWANKTAFEKLAKCYYEGRGVERSFVNMIFMYLQASERGGLSVEEYMSYYKVDDPSRLLFDAMTDMEHKRFDGAEEKQKQLKAIGDMNYMVVQSVLALERDKNEEKSELLLKAASERGCELGMLLYALFAGRKQHDEEYIKRLGTLANKTPVASDLLGGYYWKKGQEKNDESLIKAAIECFKEADRHAFLTGINAKRLIEYNEEGAKRMNVVCDSIEMRRLQILALPCIEQ